MSENSTSAPMGLSGPSRVIAIKRRSDHRMVTARSIRSPLRCPRYHLEASSAPGASPRCASAGDTTPAPDRLMADFTEHTGQQEPLQRPDSLGGLSSRTWNQVQTDRGLLCEVAVPRRRQLDAPAQPQGPGAPPASRRPSADRSPGLPGTAAPPRSPSPPAPAPAAPG